MIIFLFYILWYSQQNTMAEFNPKKGAVEQKFGNYTVRKSIFVQNRFPFTMVLYY